MTYNLYFEAYKQAHIVRLGEHEGTCVQYLTVNTASRDEILTIDKSLKLVSSTCVDDDKKVFVDEITIDNNSITILLDEKEPTKDVLDYSEIVRVRNNKKTITIENAIDNQNAYSVFDIVVKYHKYSGKIRVHCMPSDDLYDVVLDFGSEASQMLIRHNADGAGVNPHQLFAYMLRHYWQAVVGGNRRVYDQQDDNPELFRSIFFKKENASMDNHFEMQEPNNQDSFVNFITRRNRNSGERIPNVKISFLTGQQIEGADRTRLHVGIIMRFLHEALKRICELQKEAMRGIEVNTAIRFTILLPNVMPQSNVSSLIHKLHELANTPEFLKKFSDCITVPYIQVACCSESDASFLERMNVIGLAPGDRCLTIDIGKGTTDFSITKKIDANKATSLFRSGFVGAGNAVSYAIFDNCIEQMVGKSKKKEVIKRVLDAEPALLFDLDNTIEEIKHNWDKNSFSKSPLAEISPNSSVEVVLDKIRMAKGISDTTGSIKKMAEEITENILKRLPDVKINKIVISGRAFRFNELKEVLEKKLAEKFRGVDCVYNAQSAKSGCLLGASSTIKLSLSSSMVGMPFILDASKLDLSNPKEFLKEIAESANTDKSVTTTMNVVASNNTFDSIQRIGNSVWRQIQDIFRNDDEGFSRGGASSAIAHVNSTDEARELMSQGKEYSKINSNSLISISGRYYVPADQYTIDDSHRPYQIYFDGEEFYLRHKEGSHKLVAAAMQGDQNLCFESQFPYSRSIYNDDSNIPD